MRIILFFIIVLSFLLSLMLTMEKSSSVIKERFKRLSVHQTEKTNFEKKQDHFSVKTILKPFKDIKQHLLEKEPARETIPVAIGNRQKLFKVADAIKEQVGFWEKIYGAFDSRTSVLHDSRNLEVVYEVLDFNYLERKKLTDVQKHLLRRRLVLKSRARIIKALKKLSRLQKTGRLNSKKLSPYERTIYNKWQTIKGFSFAAAASHVREQYGQKDMVQKAQERAKKYIIPMQKIFYDHDVPSELVYLAFVESSFNIEAESAAGAVGVWQIMPQTGKKFLLMNKHVDERVDPIKATEVAAFILRESYQKLKSWPLAIMAYNVGWPEIKKALQQIKGNSLEDIIQSGRRGAIGFAAKNFYSSYIAMLNTCANFRASNVYTPGVALNYKMITLKHDLRLRDILFGEKISLEIFKSLNPEFQRAILLSKVKIPEGTRIKVPRGQKEIDL